MQVQGQQLSRGVRMVNNYNPAGWSSASAQSTRGQGSTAVVRREDLEGHWSLVRDLDFILKAWGSLKDTSG